MANIKHRNDELLLLGHGPGGGGADDTKFYVDSEGNFYVDSEGKFYTWGGEEPGLAEVIYVDSNQNPYVDQTGANYTADNTKYYADKDGNLYTDRNGFLYVSQEEGT